MCGNNGFGGNCSWILIIILLLVCCGGCGGYGAYNNNGCGCNNGCNSTCC